MSIHIAHNFWRRLVATVFLCLLSHAVAAAPLLDLEKAGTLARDDDLGFPSEATSSSSLLASRWAAPPSVTWNELALQGIQKYYLNPLRAARLLAHLHAALHDAWHQCEEAKADLRCVRIAQHVAGGRTMEYFFPEEVPGRFAALTLSALASMGLREQDRSALEIGRMAAWGAVLRAVSDGADRPLLAARRPPLQPGTWRPTPPLFAINPTEQGAPRWRTWLLSSSSEVVPPPPLEYGSARYIAQVREVLEVNIRLTEKEKKIADDWNLDIGTATPPGVWNFHAMRLMSGQALNVEQSTRLLAELNLAMFDALLACWSAKLTWWTERPVTEVSERFDPSFVPYLRTPPFPGYVSGHASVSGAAAYVLGARMPKVTDDVLTMAHEAAMSRLYGGIHLRHDNDEGLKLGLEVGRRVVERFDARSSQGNQAAKK